eukprot:COSAG02_NODE_21490_length_786_cov_1.007278_1_plen_169_part_01
MSIYGEASESLDTGGDGMGEDSLSAPTNGKGGPQATRITLYGRTLDTSPTTDVLPLNEYCGKPWHVRMSRGELLCTMVAVLTLLLCWYKWPATTGAGAPLPPVDNLVSPCRASPPSVLNGHYVVAGELGDQASLICDEGFRPHENFGRYIACTCDVWSTATSTCLQTTH